MTSSPLIPVRFVIILLPMGVDIFLVIRWEEGRLPYKAPPFRRLFAQSILLTYSSEIHPGSFSQRILPQPFFSSRTVVLAPPGERQRNRKDTSLRKPASAAVAVRRSARKTALKRTAFLSSSNRSIAFIAETVSRPVPLAQSKDSTSHDSRLTDVTFVRSSLEKCTFVRSFTSWDCCFCKIAVLFVSDRQSFSAPVTVTCSHRLH